MVDISSYFSPKASRCFVIAEVAQTHEGSLGQAYAFVDAVAETGADAIKFQTHIAAEESTPDEPFRVRFSRQDASRYDYWKRMEFEPEQWRGLAHYANSRDLVFMSSPFSEAAVTLLDPLVPAWKVGSGEVNNPVLIDALCRTGKPILLSSGMSSWAELEASVDLLQQRNIQYLLMQTTSMYPTPPKKLGLNVLSEMQARFRCPVGLSDHSGSIFPSLAAFTLGARAVEVHVTLSPWMFGPDVSSSITVDALKQLVQGIRMLETALENPLDKDAIAEELREMRQIFCKSVVPTRNLPAGTQLQPGDLTIKKPGHGIPAEQLPGLYGKTLKRSVSRDEFFTTDDLEAASPDKIRIMQ